MRLDGAEICVTKSALLHLHDSLPFFIDTGSKESKKYAVNSIYVKFSWIILDLSSPVWNAFRNLRLES